MSYPDYANILKWLALALLAYPATAILVANDWPTILRATFVPHIEFNTAFLFIITGVLGTSISPYMFFWQASEEVEEEQEIAAREGKRGPAQLPPHFIRNMRIDTSIGMISSQLVQWFIIITTGTVLFAHGVKNINSAADAAAALEPLVKSFPHSGQIARGIFAFGVVGLGLLAIPVLSGSAAYAMAEALGWKEGLSRKFYDAKGFYGVILLATLFGLAAEFYRRRSDQGPDLYRRLQRHCRGATPLCPRPNKRPRGYSRRTSRRPALSHFCLARLRRDVHRGRGAHIYDRAWRLIFAAGR